jgi:hypothetical protein
MKMKLDIATLHEEERRLATSLLKRVNEKSAKTMRPEDSIPTSPNAKPKDAKPKGEVPSKQMTAGDFLDLVEKYLSGLSANNPVAAGLGLKQGKKGGGFVAGSEWTIADKEPPAPKDQIGAGGNALTKDERIAFYAHPPGEKVEDVPITVLMIKNFELAPPALGSPTEGRGSQSSQTDKSDKRNK